jgi:hypothetical protein
MTRVMTVMCTLFLASVVGLAAGGQGATAGKSPRTLDPNKTLRLTGCLKRGSHGFELDNATQKGSQGKKNYQVVGVIPPGIRLSQHLNQEVQLTGALTDGNATMFNLSSTGFAMVAAHCN